MITTTNGYTPFKFRPRDFDELDTFAADNEWAAEMATNLAADEVNPARYWGTYFAALREFRGLPD